MLYILWLASQHINTNQFENMYTWCVANSAVNTNPKQQASPFGYTQYMFNVFSHSVKNTDSNRITVCALETEMCGKVETLLGQRNNSALFRFKLNSLTIEDFGLLWTWWFHP